MPLAGDPRNNRCRNNAIALVEAKFGTFNYASRHREPSLLRQWPHCFPLAVALRAGAQNLLKVTLRVEFFFAPFEYVYAV